MLSIPIHTYIQFTVKVLAETVGIDCKKIVGCTQTMTVNNKVQ